MNTLNSTELKRSVASVVAGLVFCSAAQAIPSLDPLSLGVAPTGAGQGLAGSWYKLQNDAHFSNFSYTETDSTSPRFGETAAIKTFGWGTGIWAATDIADIVAGRNPYVTATASTLGSVSYSNNIYNNTLSSGGYGNPWAPDYNRTLTPIVGGANTCDLASEAAAACSAEQNYAALFGGYIYIATAGLYDFGIFADDGFIFNLLGANGTSLSMQHNAVAGSSGRSFYELGSENGNAGGVGLGAGYYGIDLAYFNRLEAGVIDLGWRGPANATWTVIPPDQLYNNAPEPSSFVLVSLALAGLWGSQKRRRAASST
jgi:hypothetical protein